MQTYYADLHIHIGYSSGGQAIKRATARNLTVENILNECLHRKGIQIIGLVDCLAPAVIADLTNLTTGGKLRELPGGGLRWQEMVTLLPGAELETREENGCRAHYLIFFPSLEIITEVSNYLKTYMRDIAVSAVNCRLTAAVLLRVSARFGGVFIPAHIFTPHKSLYGKCADRLTTVFPDQAEPTFPAVELGLSADARLADTISELESKTFLSNSDAHSLPKIGREYNILNLASPDFSETVLALQQQGGRGVTANYGLDPELGKYHRTFCLNCGEIARSEPPVRLCPACCSSQVVVGVLDRISEIQDRKEPVHPAHRPPYYHQIPLEFIPGIGPKTLDRLIQSFGNEMAVLHTAEPSAISAVAGVTISDLIRRVRQGEMALNPGGGGKYGTLSDGKFHP